MRWTVCLFLLAGGASADGPLDNVPDKVRRIPPPGIAVPEETRANLHKRVQELGQTIAGMQDSLKTKPALRALLPDVEIFHKAVHDALKYDEFYTPAELVTAGKLLDLGFERAAQLREGKPAWPTQTGLVVRGYRSKIDDSVQPYGLVVPASYKPDYPHRYRLDFWCHGRGEKLTELAFLDQRLKNPGEFTPRDAFVVHLYGRYCNANKFAGEVDLLETLDSMRARYPIDDNRLVIRGFSMGGAACWQFAVHYPGMWAAAAPGAGFSETPEFLRVFQDEKLVPTWYEKKLWHLYNCTDYALNLFNCPTVAYSGELDKQKQAADAMSRALEPHGLKLTHIIGPKTGHSYHPDAKRQINEHLDAIVARGRQPVPRKVRFVTYTLRYPQSYWVRVEGLEEHWKQARVEAEIVDARSVRVRTGNVSALTLHMPAGHCPLGNGSGPKGSPNLSVDDQVFPSGSTVPGVGTDRSWVVHLRRVDKVWQVVSSHEQNNLRKQPGLQGPIDDAFWDRFIFVLPTGKPLHEKTGAWVEAESKHAIEHWRRQFRGQAIVKKDTEITEADLASSHLILWGDPSSNQLIKRVLPSLPVQWTDKTLTLGERSWETSTHVPLLIYPNPLNLQKYVVLNSGFTFREYDYLNNARQVPKLPDFALVDTTMPSNARTPGKIVEAGFFGEKWEWQPRP